MIRFVFLSEAFYQQMNGCNEILLKERRPYLLALITQGSVTFAIPLRSHIKHQYVFYTNKACLCGLDYTKAVVITDQTLQIDHTRQPVVRQDEFDALRGREHDIMQGMHHYLHDYRHALQHQSHPRNAQIIKMSALQYFHAQLGIV